MWNNTWATNRRVQELNGGRPTEGAYYEQRQHSGNICPATKQLLAREMFCMEEWWILAEKIDLGIKNLDFQNHMSLHNSVRNGEKLDPSKYANEFPFKKLHRIYFFKCRDRWLYITGNDTSELKIYLILENQHIPSWVHESRK